MRDLGYTLATAIADIVDNSIAAKATEIIIFCDLARDEPTLVIVDNGEGMTKDQLIVAMKHGSVNPREERNPMDLGRFGLGLKASSFSQCRHLSVVSSQNSIRAGADWNLDLVREKDEWIISILDEGEIKQLPYVEFLSATGTAVIWQKLDRLFENQFGDKRDEIVNEKLDLVEKHLALVFHRFLAGEIKNRHRISIAINGHRIEPFDPFCRKNSATRILPEEIVRVEGKEIRIQPYILPHHSRLSVAEYDYYQDRSNFLSNQGAYIYRNGRLMTWGGWFRLVPKGEATKLARILIDFPNALDEKWTIDIKKSKAKPPHEVLQRIKQIIAKITEGSTQIQRGRGRKLFEKFKAPVWERYSDKGIIHYDLNGDHPLLAALEQSLADNQRSKLMIYMKSIVSSLPVEMIYSDYSIQPLEVYQSEKDTKRALEQLKELKKNLCENNRVDALNFRDIVNSTRLFVNHQKVVDKFIEEEFNEQPD
jgi:hypothetical protein